MIIKRVPNPGFSVHIELSSQEAEALLTWLDITASDSELVPGSMLESLKRQLKSRVRNEPWP